MTARVPINQQINNLLAEFSKFERDTNKLFADTVADVAEAVKKRAARSIKRETLGDSYGEHDVLIAGAKGKAPNSQTGKLADSLLAEHFPDDLTSFVGTFEPYAMAQETLRKHPFLVPALRKGKNDFKRKLKINLKKAIEAHKND